MTAYSIPDVFSWNCPECGKRLHIPSRYCYSDMNLCCSTCNLQHDIKKHYFSFAAGLFDDAVVEVAKK